MKKLVLQNNSTYSYSSSQQEDSQSRERKKLGPINVDVLGNSLKLKKNSAAQINDQYYHSMITQ